MDNVMVKINISVLTFFKLQIKCDFLSTTEQSCSWFNCQRNDICTVVTAAASVSVHRTFVSRDPATCCNVVGRKWTCKIKERWTEELLIAPCINVTVCAVSYLSVKTVAQILDVSFILVIATLVSSEAAASWSWRVGELTRRNDQAKC